MNGDEPKRPSFQRLSLDGVEIVVLETRKPVDAPAGLTAAEAEVAALVVAGRSNKEIAAARSVSVNTIAKQLRRIYEKLGVSSRFELVATLEGTGPKKMPGA